MNFEMQRGNNGSNKLPFPPVIIAIAGASGSGKSTLAMELARILGGLHFSLDDYYRDLSHLPPEKRSSQNFDEPGMIDAPLLIRHIEELSQSRSIERPIYDYASYLRDPEKTDLVVPGSLIIVEGLFTLYFPDLRPLYQLSVFVDTPDDMCYSRRMKRDIEERGRTEESVKHQYDATVRPCGLAFVRPLIDFADLVLEGTEAMDFKIEQVISALRKRGLLERIHLEQS